MLQTFRNGPVMVVGQRRDVKVGDRVLYRPESVRRDATTLGQLHPPAGIDYFAIARNHFPWRLVPNLIIGHTGYDNFILSVASSNNVSVVDATQTLTALHQTDKDGVGTGHRRADRFYNRRIILRLGRYRPRGCKNIRCSKYRTRWQRKPVTEVVPDSYNETAVQRQRKRIVIERRRMPALNKDLAAATVNNQLKQPPTPTARLKLADSRHVLLESSRHSNERQNKTRQSTKSSKKMLN